MLYLKWWYNFTNYTGAFFANFIVPSVKGKVMRAGCPTTHHQTSNMARHGYLTKAVINKLKERWSLCLTFVSCVKIGHRSLHCQCLCLIMWVVFLIGHTCMSSVFWLVFCPYIVCLSTLFWVRHMMNLFFKNVLC